MMDKLKRNTVPFRVHPDLKQIIRQTAIIRGIKIEEYTKELAENLKQDNNEKKKKDWNLFR